MRWKLFLLMVALLTGVISVQAQESGDLLGRINNLRASRGLPAYALNGALAAAAQQQAQWIVDNGQISHTHPDGSGPRTRALNAGYPSTNVGENIYGGTNATGNDAWTFWLNSAVHFNSMVSANFNEVGIGIARGSWGASFVLVFGGAGAPPPSVNANGGGGASGAAGASAPPAYLGGVDENGNIKHIVQQGDTLGDIALIYGYTWADLPYMMQLNGLSNVRDLEVGSIFLVPAHGGTFTPTPDDRPATETPVPTAVPPSITPFSAASITPYIASTPSGVIPTAVIASDNGATPTSVIATAGANVEPPELSDNATASPEGTQIAALATPSAVRVTTAALQPRSSIQTWIVIALAVQVVIVIGAGIEFVRRTIRKKK